MNNRNYNKIKDAGGNKTKYYTVYISRHSDYKLRVVYIYINRKKEKRKIRSFSSMRREILK